MGVTDDGIGDVAQQRPSQPTETAATHHDQVGADLLGQVDDRLVPAFVHPEVGDRNGAARLLDLPYLFVEYLLGFAPEVFTTRLGVTSYTASGNVRPTATTWSLALVLFARSTAFMAASCA